MAAFDNIQNLLFDKVEAIFGDTVTWTPTSGAADVIGLMLINEPTKRTQLVEQITYEPIYHKGEYRLGQFAGLFESVQAGTIEYITRGANSYVVRYADAKYDGKTFVLQLELV